MRERDPRRKRRFGRALGRLQGRAADGPDGVPRRRLRFNLRRAMFVLPNLFTLSSIFCGFYAIVLCSGAPGPQQFYQASLAVFFGIFFDMADGRVARLTRTQSDFGVQLDSLADVMTFGAAPAVIVHKWGLASLGVAGVFAAYTYVACGALRLARFNVLAQRSPGSKKYFVGLPIPLAAGVLVSLVMFHQLTYAHQVMRESHIFILVVVLAYLMVSNVRYRSFKDVKVSPKSLAVVFALIVVFAMISARVQPAFALLAFFGGYVCVGLLEEIIFFRARKRERLATASPAPSQPPDPDPNHKMTP
jgi:CDP-diacylglycerol---serine O-phosphatidyltransferase